MVPAMIDTKLMTRETYTLYGIEGDFGNKDGKLTFTEKVRPFVGVLCCRLHPVSNSHSHGWGAVVATAAV